MYYNTKEQDNFIRLTGIFHSKHIQVFFKYQHHLIFVTGMWHYLDFSDEVSQL